MLALNDPVSSVHGIGSALETKLERLGITTVRDLILHLPERYDDLRTITPIQKLKPEIPATIRGTVDRIRAMRTFRKRLTITKASVSDSTGTVECTWFGQRFIDKTIRTGDEIIIAGTPLKTLTGFEFKNPIFEKATANPLHTSGIIPVYGLTEGISQKQLRFLIDNAFKKLEPFPDDLPEQIITEETFPSLDTALRTIHKPRSFKMAEQALNRLKFDELFWIQLRASYARKLYEQHTAPAIPHDPRVNTFIADLPFTLTGDQEKTTTELLSDMARTLPMNRLIEGDVGSGKTVVACAGMLNASLAGFQSALLAPTEILAIQHYDSLSRLFKGSALGPLALLTAQKAVCNGLTLPKSVQQAKSAVIQGLKDGTIACVVGTHSLIQKDVSFARLGFVVIDEQHRFGVSQRKQLLSLGDPVPHLLSLSATPIPRTLALTLYGDLDLSIIKEKPKGRKPIITRLVSETKRTVAYDFIRDHIKRGEQVFVICPLIDEEDASGRKSVLAEHARLSKDIFPECEMRYLHGKMKAEEKQKTLSDFQENRFPILVATSVIEVGIDIPRATFMVIEGAERFGVAQLHQFRGRVGRNDLQSYCLLFPEVVSELSQKRLTLLTRYQDGFTLAEEDLKLRGEGELTGTRQSGASLFSIASIHDTDLIKRSRRWVDRIMSDTPHDLWTESMREKIQSAEEVHLE